MNIFQELSAFSDVMLPLTKLAGVGFSQLACEQDLQLIPDLSIDHRHLYLTPISEAIAPGRLLQTVNGATLFIHVTSLLSVSATLKIFTQRKYSLILAWRAKLTNPDEAKSLWDAAEALTKTPGLANDFQQLEEIKPLVNPPPGLNAFRAIITTGNLLTDSTI